MEIINRHPRASEAHANPICPIYRLLLSVVQKHPPNTHIIYIETKLSEPTGTRYMRPQWCLWRSLTDAGELLRPTLMQNQNWTRLVVLVVQQLQK